MYQPAAPIFQVMNKDKIFLLYFSEKQLENVEHLKYMGSLINDAWCKSEIRSSITMVKGKAVL
jgi:hypothetical protein